MNHLEFAALESAALDPTPWDHWIARLEKIVGHSLDGDQTTDGYSLDRCSELFDLGLSSLKASEKVLWEKHGLHRP